MDKELRCAIKQNTMIKDGNVCQIIEITNLTGRHIHNTFIKEENESFAEFMNKIHEKINEMISKISSADFPILQVTSNKKSTEEILDYCRTRLIGKIMKVYSKDYGMMEGEIKSIEFEQDRGYNIACLIAPTRLFVGGLKGYFVDEYRMNKILFGKKVDVYNRYHKKFRIKLKRETI